jgi:hypothetical protein
MQPGSARAALCTKLIKRDAAMRLDAMANIEDPKAVLDRP